MHLPPDVHSSDVATEAVELAELCGLQLDESQQFTLVTSLGQRADGLWAAFEVADIEPRQNGKGDTIQARELVGLILLGEDLLIHTAHEFATANEAFLRMAAMFQSVPELERRLARIRWANGEQGIELKSGQRLKYRARTGGAGRGFSEASLVVYDEAQHLSAEQIAASLPTMTVHPNPQVWFAGSAGLATSTQLHRLRVRALTGDAGRLAYMEHTAEKPVLNSDGVVESEPVDLDNEENVALSNPAYGFRITRDFVVSERAAMGDAQWARERCGVWDPLPEYNEAKPVKIPAAMWAWTGTSAVVEDRSGHIAVAFEVTRDGEWSSIAVAHGTPDRPIVEVVAHERGVGWLPTRLAQLTKARRPRAVGCVGAGPSASQVGPVLLAFSEEDIDRDVFHQLSTGDYRAACAGLFMGLSENTTSHREGQDALDLAAGDAAERSSGNGWYWEQRQATIPISPLVAATAAHHLFLTCDPLEAEPEPLFAVT